MKGKWIRFPNGRVWCVDENGFISGSVAIDSGFYDDIESFNDQLSEAVTGSIAGLTSFSWKSLGGGRFAFHGEVIDMLDEEDDLEEIERGSRRHAELLKAQYGLLDIEVEHALRCLDHTFDQECRLQVLHSGREIVCPAAPSECSYVRVVLDGLELAYWSDDEWKDDPSVVMGAIIGAAHGAAGSGMLSQV